MNNERIYINCPYGDKDEAKEVGARWDASEKKWYIPQTLLNQIERFNKWKPKGRVYLNCPYSDKDRAKSKGAKWDRAVGKWFFIPSKNLNEKDFKEWLQLPAESPKNTSAFMSSFPQMNIPPLSQPSPTKSIPSPNTFSPQIKMRSSPIQSRSMEDISKTSTTPEQKSVSRKGSSKISTTPVKKLSMSKTPVKNHVLWQFFLV